MTSREREPASSGLELRVLDPAVREEFEEWVRLWSRTSHREVQAHPSYGLAVASPDETLLGAMVSTRSGSVILPFCVRDVWVGAARIGRDAITPYGYGGAYVDGDIDAAAFWSSWDLWAHANGVVGITMRRHLFDDEVLLPKPGLTVHPLDNVVVDLTPDLDEIWAGFEGRARNQIRRGRDAGVTIERDESCDGIEDFYSIYIETMRAKGADEFYSFDLGSLAALVESLGPAVTLCHARVGGELVSSEMQLLGAVNGYSFLSGTSLEGRRRRANSVLKMEVIQWMKEQGARRYVLGGGMSVGDSLFKYKRSYAPKGVTEFKVTFHEAVPGASEQLIAERRGREAGWVPADDFLPPYRSPGNGEPGSA